MEGKFVDDQAIIEQMRVTAGRLRTDINAFTLASMAQDGIEVAMLREAAHLQLDLYLDAVLEGFAQAGNWKPK